MINKKIMSELTNRKPRSTIYRLINEIRKANYKLTTEDAAYVLAGELGIDIAKHLSNGQLQRLPSTSAEIKIIETKSKAISKTFQLKIKDIRANIPFLEKKVVRDCQKMIDIYMSLYLLENSIRFFILSTLGREYPSENWWHEKVPKPVRDRVEDRKKKENENRWHAKRGDHNIHYTAFGDLKDIIIKNWNVFGRCFPSQLWIQSKLAELELSRNIIAHNNPLPQDEIQRIKLYFRDWTKQIREDSK